MVIYTTYFAKLNKLPDNIVPISICLSAPYFYKGLQYKKLAPTYSILSGWKLNHNIEDYAVRFSRNILDLLNCNNVYDELKQLSDGKDIALICYEKSSDFCHRHLVAEWFNTNGFECREYQYS